MGANDVRAGGAFVEIGGVIKGLESALNRAAGRLKAFGAGVSAIGVRMAALGASITAPLIAAANASAEAGAAIYDMSRRTGISVENLSSLSFAAKLTGVGMETLEPAIRKMQKTIGGMADATEGTTGSIAHLGLEIETIRGLAPDEQFRKITKAISEIKDPTAKAAATMKVFGRSGTEILPMIDQLGELEVTARKLGLIRTTESARSAKEYEQAITLAGMAVKSIWSALSSGLIPILKQKADVMTRLAMKIREWIKANKDTVVTIFEIAAAVTILGTALVVIGTAFGYLGSAVAGVASLLGLLRSAVGGIVVIISTVLTSGLGLVIVALAGFAAYMLYASDVGKAAMSRLGEYFGELRDTALKAFAGIKDAMAAGDWKLAAQILWLGLKVAFEEGIAPLKKAWTEFKKFFIQVGNAAWYGVQAGWEEVRSYLSSSWISTTAFLKNLWTAFASSVKDVWENTQSWLEKRWLDLGETFGQMTAQERAEAEKLADQQHAANSKQIVSDELAATAAALKQKYDEQEAEAKRHQAAMSKIGANANAAFDKATADAAAGGEADKKKLADLKLQLDEATKKAKAAAEAAKSKGDGSILPPLTPRLPGGGDIQAAIFKAISVSGTFNAFAARGLGGGTPLDRIAKASETTAKNTSKLALVPRSGLRFQ